MQKEENFTCFLEEKIGELEESIDAVKREVKEELGWENLEYKFLGISEEFVTDKGYDNQQINLIYKGIYNNVIEKIEFKGLEGDWINFKWIDIKDVDNYQIYPSIVKEMVKNSDKISIKYKKGYEISFYFHSYIF